MSVSIRKARSAEHPSITTLVGKAGLPGDGMERHWDDFLVAVEDDAICGVVGLEIYGDVGLLRSLAVEPSCRRRGLGDRLVRSVLNLGRERGLKALFLLTTTAEDYFPRFGFQSVTRDALDPRLQASRELQGACPDSAVSMKLEL